MLDPLGVWMIFFFFYILFLICLPNQFSLFCADPLSIMIPISSHVAEPVFGGLGSHFKHAHVT